MSTSQNLVEAALELGFDLAGVAPLAPPPALEHFHKWLAAGRNAGLVWLEREAGRIADPATLLPTGTGMVVVGLGHARAAGELEGGGRVARYALGRDYHNVVGKRLAKLARHARAIAGARNFRKVVDAGPMLERSHGAVAGLGFESKAGNLLERRHGPWFFLGELLLEIDGWEPEPATPALGSCGTCRACIDACPTQAIVEPGVVDAGKCISYHTIENPGPSPVELRSHFDAWVFGCDVCSEVCPFGRKAPNRAATFGLHEVLDGSKAPGGSVLLDWLRFDSQVDRERFRARFEGSPLSRPGPDGMARNSAIALGNRPSAEGRAGLLEALERHSAPVVREASAWALAHGHGRDRGVIEALERAVSREIDTSARAALREHLAGATGSGSGRDPD